MGDTRYIDPVTGRLVHEHWDWKEQKLYIHQTEDVAPLLDELAHERGMGNAGWSKGRTFRKIGSIPNLEVERILREEGINVMDNSPESQKRLRRYFQENPKLSTKF
jgi:hypothetical protein